MRKGGKLYLDGQSILMIDISRETDFPNMRGAPPFGSVRLCLRDLRSRRL